MTDSEREPALTPQPSATLDCPRCQTTITYYDVTGSYYYGCPNCQTYFKYENDDPPQILRQFDKTTSQPAIALGTEGYLFSLWVRLVGYVVKREAGTLYDWREYYLLLNDGTYRTLSEYHDHWMWSEPTTHTLVAYTSHHAMFEFGKQAAHAGAYVHDRTDNRRYTLFNSYQIELVSVVGEFDYNLLDEAQLTIYEYIQPPTMLIAETVGDTVDWYEARYVEADELEKGFDLDAKTLRPHYGVGAIQPNPTDERWLPTIRIWSLGAVGALVLHLFLAMLNPHPAQVLNQHFSVAKDTATTEGRPTVRSNAFQINGPAHVGVEYVTDLNNHWAEFEAELINQKTGKTYSFTKAVEYYQGVDGGEAWSEGDKADDASLSRIPSGRYFLTIKPYTDEGNLSLDVHVTAGPAPFSNVLVWLLLSGLYPLYLFARGRWFERDRWAQSDYNPNASND
ncbi:hypothetical protein FAES_5112 [Fibrella aestuarina BUZ 2]|uniref:Uncharacterized protein n=1 Tax=Fibrella aestuarina BUZ 2 TaxID=1166018 RepID=I0KG58_9BACT|nr:DUF4178 domain-containing protein [Fibrella aestuarina]CCH03111.1 hypothetical protein FAES_5112 [Fibrella aestuarina BUZ 2]